MKRDQRLLRSEAAILEAGIRTFLRNPSAGMSEIAVASGVGRTTLYRHYESRTALIEAIALQCLDEIDAALAPVYASSPERAIPATFEVLIPLADRYRFLSSLWPEAEGDSPIARRMEAASRGSRALMDFAQAEGVLDPTLPSVWLTELFEMTLYTAWSLLESRAVTSEQAVLYATRSFLRGCGASSDLAGPGLDPSA